MQDERRPPKTGRPEPEVGYDYVGATEGGDAALPVGANCDRFTFALYVFVLGAICLFGLVGNTLSFVVLRWDRRVHVAAFLLQVMAVADNVFLTTTALSQMTMALTMYMESTSMAAAAASTRTSDVGHHPLDDLYTVTAYVQVRRPPRLIARRKSTVDNRTLISRRRIPVIRYRIQRRRSSARGHQSTLLLKPQVSVTVTHGVSVVGVAGWPVILTGWPAGRRKSPVRNQYYY